MITYKLFYWLRYIDWSLIIRFIIRIRHIRLKLITSRYLVRIDLMKNIDRNNVIFIRSAYDFLRSNSQRREIDMRISKTIINRRITNLFCMSMIEVLNVH